MHIKICIVILAMSLSQTFGQGLVGCITNSAENFISTNLDNIEAVVDKVLGSTTPEEISAELKEIVTDIISNEVFQKCLSGPNILSDLPCFINAVVKSPQTVISIVKDSNLLALVVAELNTILRSDIKLTTALSQGITKLIADITSCLGFSV